ncbi:MAG: MauE/DoxX family redox-associated membrane protein [Terrimicrobiaceae bacterium]
MSGELSVEGMKPGNIVALWVVRIVLAGVFLWAGWSKFVNPQVFADGIVGFQFFPTSTVNIMALSVPVWELVTAVLLLTPWWWRRGALSGFLLASAFTLIFAWAWYRGLTIQCSCFGASGSGISPALGFLRAAVLLVSTGWLYLHGQAAMRRKVS